MIGKDITSLGPLAQELLDLDFKPILARDSISTERALISVTPDLILFDHPWPREMTPEWIGQLAREYSSLVLCSEEHFDTGLLALRMGAMEFLVKPLERLELAAAVSRIIDNALMYRQGEFYTSVLRHEPPSLLVGDSPPLRQLLKLIQAVAPTDATVLILGESGVGKEKVA